jgi:hypothetical protein
MAEAAPSLDGRGALFSLDSGSAGDWLRVEFHAAAERSGGYVHGGAVASLAEAITMRGAQSGTVRYTEVDFLSPVTSRDLEVRVEESDCGRRIALAGLREGDVCFTAHSIDLGPTSAAEPPVEPAPAPPCAASEGVGESHREGFRDRAGIRVVALDQEAVELVWHRSDASLDSGAAPIGALVDCSGILLRGPGTRDHVGYTRGLEYLLGEDPERLDGVHARGSLDLSDGRHALFRVELTSCDGTRIGYGQAIYRLREEQPA